VRKNTFLLISFFLVVALSGLLPFFLDFSKEIPLISLVLGQIALVFLFVLGSFPKAEIKELMRVSSVSLLFIGLAYSLLGFLPFEQKVFVLQISQTIFPDSVSVNLASLLVLNIFSFTLLNIDFNLRNNVSQEETTAKKFDEIKPKQNEKFKEEPKQQKPIKQEIKKLQVEEDRISRQKLETALKREVDSLFDLYLHDYEGTNDTKEQSIDLELFENALLNNMDMNIRGAICLDKHAETLKDTVFHWDGTNKDTLIEFFKKNDAISRQIGAGKLCQLLVSNDDHWYIISKFRGNYLVLKSANMDIKPLINTAYKVFKSL
jgi:cell division protein FtsB